MKNLNLINVYTASDKITAELIKGFLESHNIKTLIQPSRIGSFRAAKPSDKDWQVFVPKKNENEVKELLKDFNFDKKN